MLNLILNWKFLRSGDSTIDSPLWLCIDVNFIWLSLTFFDIFQVRGVPESAGNDCIERPIFSALKGHPAARPPQINLSLVDQKRFYLSNFKVTTHPKIHTSFIKLFDEK